METYFSLDGIRAEMKTREQYCWLSPSGKTLVAPGADGDLILFECNFDPDTVTAEEVNNFIINTLM